MIITDHKQGSEEWFRSRLCVVTGSEFYRIITSRGIKADTNSQNGYMYELLAEYLSGKTDESFSNKDMERGKELESEARDYLSFQTDIQFQTTGLIYLDERKLIGISPDGLAKRNRTGCEIKCPKASTHVRYMITQQIPSIYWPQVQGGMWITGYNKWYFMSYHPDLNPLIIIAKRDNNYIQKMETYINDFVGRMLITRKDLKEV